MTNNSCSDCFLLISGSSVAGKHEFDVCGLLFMQNFRAQNLLLTQCMRRRRWGYRRQAPYYWTLPRPVESWFKIHYPDLTIPGDYFQRLLRMNIESFDLLLSVLLYVYSITNMTMSDDIWGIEACQDVVEAPYEFRNLYIKFPTTVAETMAYIETFMHKSRLPNIVGAIDGTHINIISPRESAVDNFSWNQQHDFKIQVVADGKGYPGSLHDARAYRNSSLYLKASNKEVLREFDEKSVSEIFNLVRDNAYPIFRRLMKPRVTLVRLHLTRNCYLHE